MKFLKIWFNNSILSLTIMSILLKIRQNLKVFVLLIEEVNYRIVLVGGAVFVTKQDKNPVKHAAVKDAS